MAVIGLMHSGHCIAVFSSEENAVKYYAAIKEKADFDYFLVSFYLDPSPEDISYVIGVHPWPRVDELSLSSYELQQRVD